MKEIDPTFIHAEIERVFTEAGLTDREKDVLARRFALFGHEPGMAQSLEWIAKDAYSYPVSRERIRQIEAKALRKIRETVTRDWSEYAWWVDISKELAFFSAIEGWSRRKHEQQS